MAKVLDEIVRGWSTQRIFTLQDGFAFTIGCPTSTVAGLGCDANVVKGKCRGVGETSDPMFGYHAQTIGLATRSSIQ